MWLPLAAKGVAEPKNLLVKTGTLSEEALDFCGGISEDTQKLIAGGPMMGTSLYDASGVFTKNRFGAFGADGRGGKRQSALQLHKLRRVR